MSAFLAIGWQHAADPHVSMRLIEALAHRGTPRVWSEPGVTLAAFETDESEGLALADDFVVVLTARIDNRAEVDALLDAASASDAERLLLAWRRWGVAALDLLIGDFAGAVWDRRRRRLTVLRDPVGVRGAMIARAPGRVLAATSIPALLADPGVDRSIDERWVAAYLAGIGDYATSTGYRGIARLEPGTVAEQTEAGEWKTRRWFRWRVERIRERDPQAYAERFRELFAEAVRCRLAGARRPGVLLSGGLDSTSVMVTARAVAPEADLVAIAMAFEDERGDERHLQRLVAERAGAHLRWVSPLDGQPFGDPDEVLGRHGVPPVAPNRFYSDVMAAGALAEDVDLVLDGLDGDGIVGGNWFFFSDLLVRGRIPTWLREARAAERVHGARRRQILRRLTVMPLVPPQARLAARRLRGRSQVPGFIDPGLARRTGLERTLGQEVWRPGATFAKAERLGVSPLLMPLVMEMVEEEWAARGIRIAHPFLDRRLIAYCLGLPREQKISGGYTKVVLRAAMRGLLPPEVAERAEKAELSSPFFTGLAGLGSTYLAKGLHAAASNPSPWFQEEPVARLMRDRGEGRLFPSFRIAQIALWRAWLEREPSRRGRASSASTMGAR